MYFVYVESRKMQLTEIKLSDTDVEKKLNFKEKFNFVIHGFKGNYQKGAFFDHNIFDSIQFKPFLLSQIS